MVRHFSVGHEAKDGPTTPPKVGKRASGRRRPGEAALEQAESPTTKASAAERGLTPGFYHNWPHSQAFLSGWSIQSSISNARRR